MNLSEIKLRNIIFPTNDGRIIMTIDMESGHITLNEEIPQDEAVHAFIAAVNRMVNREEREYD